MIFKRKTTRAPSSDNSNPTVDGSSPSFQQVLSLSQTPAENDESFYAGLQAEIRISKAEYNPKTKQVAVNGWCLSPEPRFDLFLQVVDTNIISAVKPGTEDRLDVFERLPQYGNKKSGWRAHVDVELLPAGSRARIVYVSENRQHAFDKIITNLAVETQANETLTIQKCVYSPLRSQCFIDAEIQTDRDALDFTVTAKDNVALGVVHSNVLPLNSRGRRPVRISVPVAGLRDREQITLMERGNPSLSATSTIVSLNDSPRRVTATTPSVFRDVTRLEDTLDLEDLFALKQSLADYPRPERAKGEICYFPPFDNQATLSDHFHRASWYLTGTGSPVTRVTFAAPEGQNTPGPVPECFATRNLDTTTLECLPPNATYLDALLRAQTIYVWRPLAPDLQKYLAKILGKKPTIITVATHDPASVEYGNYCRGPWMLLPEEDKALWLQESQERFRGALREQREAGKSCSAVFGTGPSIDKAFDFDFSACMTVACNSIVANDALLDHIRPAFICAGDAVSHFGVSKYAETFRADLIKALTERNVYLFTSAAIGFLLVQKHPEIRDRVILCEQGFTGLNCDLENIWSLPRFDSTLNIHMLPIAATFSDTVFMLGLDGRDPNPSNNEDFWAHSKAAQYHDLVDSGHQAHPTFAINRAQATEDRYLSSVHESFLAGEALGKSFFALAPSFTPAVHARPAPEGCFEGDPTNPARRLRAPRSRTEQTAPAETAPRSRALVVMRMNRRHFSGGRYHGTILAEAMADFCDEVVVWSNNMPPWSGDLAYSPNHHKVSYWIDDFLQAPAGDFNYVVVLPDGSSNPSMYYQVFEKAKSCNAKTAFLNFESPNWFNALSPTPKKMSDADNWFAAACFSDIILSSAQTAVPFAESFYQTLYHTPSFAVAPPAINSPIADLVKKQDIVREKQIILISRFGNVSAHKNINAIFDCITPEMEGYTLALIAGTSDLPDDETLSAFTARLASLGLSLKLLYMISDREKYEEIAKSELMIFPSLFEGFGYPPVEAGYMGTPCIAYDLPVLTEFSEDHGHFVPWGDHAALRAKISEVLQAPQSGRSRTQTPQVLTTAGLSAFSQTLQHAFATAGETPAALKFSPDLFELARKVYLDGCREAELTYGLVSEQELYSIAARYEQLATEAREKLQARQGRKRAAV
jgi:glycosyltransferase involved in cell wall biosynthesis